MNFRVRLIAAVGSATLAALASWVTGYAPQAHVGYAILGALLCFLVLKPQPGTLKRWPVVALLTVAFLAWSAYAAISLNRCVRVRAALSRSNDPALVAEAQRCKETWPDRASTRAPERQ